METLGGFPNLPALWLRRAKPGYVYACLRAGIAMETLGGFPNLPALWLRRAKPGYAYACLRAGIVMETLGGFPNLPAMDSVGQSPPSSTRSVRPCRSRSSLGIRPRTTGAAPHADGLDTFLTLRAVRSVQGLASVTVAVWEQSG